MAGFAPSDTFLGSLDEDDRDALLARSHRQQLGGGDTLIQEGDVDGHVYIILSGSVDVVRSTAEGPAMRLGRRGAGEVIGELGALDANPRSATVRAAEATEVASMVASEFLSFITSRPALSLRLIQSMARRLRAAEAKAAGLGPIDVNEFLSSR